MRISRRTLVAAGTLILLGVGGLLIPISPDAVRLKIAGGTPGGNYIRLAQTLSRILEELPDDSFGPNKAIETSGSLENLALLAGQPPEADLAFVNTRAVVDLPENQRGEIRLLADLYDEFVQVVVHKDSGIRAFRDLHDRRIYIGAAGSGNESTALEVLGGLGVEVTAEMRKGTLEDSYEEAVFKLQRREIDAAFYVSGIPAKAVDRARASGECTMLQLTDADPNQLRAISRFRDKFTFKEIPANAYGYQDFPVSTLVTRALLVSTRSLADKSAEGILGAIFDRIQDFQQFNPEIETIDFKKPDLESVVLHDGAGGFWREQDRSLIIATGVIGGRYWEIGKGIQELLAQRGIRSRVVPTDGSLENARRLASEPNTLALMQYEVALAAHSGISIDTILDTPLNNITVPHVERMRRIVALHPEKTHIMIRREKLQGSSEPSVSALRGLRVSFGPRNGGTQLLARAILLNHGLEDKGQFMSGEQMVKRLFSGQLDAGFFASGVPSEAMKRILADSEIQLLSISPGKMSVRSPLRISTIDGGTYPSQREGESPITTIETRSVLVTSEGLTAVDPYELTDAIFDGIDVLGIEGGVAT